MSFLVRLSSFPLLAASLTACMQQTDWDARRALPEETQRAAYDRCAKKQGVAHWLHLHKLKNREGLLHVLGSDGSGVTVAEARNLNRCAGIELDAIIASN